MIIGRRARVDPIAGGAIPVSRADQARVRLPIDQDARAVAVGQAHVGAEAGDIDQLAVAPQPAAGARARTPRCRRPGKAA